MLEQRVAKLEEKIDLMGSILTRLEPKINEILQTGAKQTELTKLQIDVAETKGRLSGVEGRLSGLNDRVASLPTTWTMLGIVFTTWALGSGILIFAMNYLKR